MNVKIFALMSVLALATVSTNARAEEGQFAKKHPRRAQVLRRDRRLKNQTENAEKSGKITDAQADKLEKEEGAIKNQEQADAAANGGHITKGEQRQLNREENRVHRQLRRDERKDAAKPEGGANTPADSGSQPSQ
jgi:hypothetical protein